MRNIKVLSNPDQNFRDEMSRWNCVTEIKDPAEIKGGERFIKYSSMDRQWYVYTKSKVHLATPRYCGRHNNILSAVHAARSSMMIV
jgi:hypothetical protein